MRQFLEIFGGFRHAESHHGAVLSGLDRHRGDRAGREVAGRHPGDSDRAVTCPFLQVVLPHLDVENPMCNSRIKTYQLDTFNSAF